MAKKATTYGDIVADIKRGDYAPVYILMGEEPYYIDKTVELLEEAVVEPDDRDFNFNVFYGAESKVEEVVSVAQQYPVMAPRRIVILKEAQALDRAKANLDKIAPYLNRPNKDCVLVIAFKGENLNATSALMKAAANNAVVLKSEKIRDYQLSGPIKSYVMTKQLSIEDKAVDMLAEFAGSDLTKLFSEIDKLAISLPPGKTRITPEAVESLIGISKEFNNFELTQAVGAKDFVKAMKIVEYFSRNPRQNPVVMSVAMLFNFFVKLSIGVFTPSQTETDLMKAMDVKSAFIFNKDYRPALANYSGMRPLTAVSLLRDLDARSKGVGSMQKEHDILRETICKILAL